MDQKLIQSNWSLTTPQIKFQNYFQKTVSLPNNISRWSSVYFELRSWSLRLTGASMASSLNRERRFVFGFFFLPSGSRELLLPSPRDPVEKSSTLAWWVSENAANYYERKLILTYLHKNRLCSIPRGWGARFMFRHSRPKFGTFRLSRPNFGLFRLSRPNKKSFCLCSTQLSFVRENQNISGV